MWGSLEKLRPIYLQIPASRESRQEGPPGGTDPRHGRGVLIRVHAGHLANATEQGLTGGL